MPGVSGLPAMVVTSRVAMTTLRMVEPNVSVT